jgi:hypothetical protein
MAPEELANINWELKMFDTSRKEDEKEGIRFKSQPSCYDSECKDFKRLKSCVECSYWDSCPEHYSFY